MSMGEGPLFALSPPPAQSEDRPLMALDLSQHLERMQADEPAIITGGQGAGDGSVSRYVAKGGWLRGEIDVSAQHGERPLSTSWARQRRSSCLQRADNSLPVLLGELFRSRMVIVTVTVIVVMVVVLLVMVMDVVVVVLSHLSLPE